MPALQAATTLAWGDAARLQGAIALAWGDAARLQSRGSAYTAPGVGGGTVITPGSLAPLRDITAATRYLDTSALTVTDLRDGAVLPVTSVSLDLADGSDLWTLQAAGNGALAAALRAGEQPATVQVTLGADVWRFVVEEISQPITFESTDCTFRGRSLAAAAGAPYQAVTSWIVDAPTTPAQIASLANTFTGVAVDWGLVDWLVPAGAWSASADPLGVVRQMAAAVGAVVEAHRTELKLAVRPRYATAPNTWSAQRPDVQIAWEAVEAASQERNDQPEYNGVLVSGTQSGGLLQARLQGTSGSVQAPMVTDPLLTDTVAQIARAESLLYGYGGRARETRTLQLHGGVVARGALVRCVEPAETWTGVVRSVSVRATLEQARQTIAMERPTSFPAGTALAPPPTTCVPDPHWGNVVLMLHGDGEDGSSVAVDSSLIGHTSTVYVGTPTNTTTQKKFGTASLYLSDNFEGWRFATTALSLAADEDCTIEFWIRPELMTSRRAVFTTNWPGALINAVSVGIDGGSMSGSVGSSTAAFAPGALILSVWQHIALCRRGALLTMFLDGVAGTPQTVTRSAVSASEFALGLADSGFGWSSGGTVAQVDELRVTKGVARYISNFTPAVLPFCNHT